MTVFCLFVSKVMQILLVGTLKKSDDECWSTLDPSKFGEIWIAV